jgi:Tol biopolymer transport system component
VRRLYLLGIFLLSLVSFAEASATGDLLVIASSGRLVLIHSDGTQELIAEKVSRAAFSRDRRFIAFTIDQKLMAMTVATRATLEIAQAPEGALFAQVEWAPDGKGIAYEVIVRRKSDELFLAPFPPQNGQPRNLGHWYQGFSFSPDGSRIVHAINHPFALEMLDLTSGKRTILTKADNILWQARFSPDGRFIAYTKTVTPSRSDDQSGNDDEPDCANPPTELHLYSLADMIDTVVAFRSLKAPESVYNFSWSPDSRTLAMELGTNNCEYPAIDAGVFITSVDQKYQMKISNASPAFEPIFSHDGSAIAFLDASQSPYRLWHYDIQSRTLKQMGKSGDQESLHRLLDWR